MVQGSGGNQHCIPKSFGVQALAIHPPEEAIFRVSFFRSGVPGSALPIGVGKQNLPVERFDIPAGIAKFRCQRIQQSLVGGVAAHDAEVVRGLHETHTHAKLPDAIHHHAGGEGIIL